MQYAHARICSIIRKAAQEAGILLEGDSSEELDRMATQLIGRSADLSLLTDPTELALMRKMDEFPLLVATSARDRAPYRLTHYVQEIASSYHQFYTQCHVLTDDKDLTKSRLALCDATRILIALALSLLGVSAPTKM